MHQSRASGRLLNFIGSMSGPVTTKWPLMNRMVNVVILDLVMPVDQHDLCYITDSGHAPRRRWLKLILPSVEAVIPPQEFVWDRAKLYPKQAAAFFERKRISVIEASTKSGKTIPLAPWSEA